MKSILTCASMPRGGRRLDQVTLGDLFLMHLVSISKRFLPMLAIRHETQAEVALRNSDLRLLSTHCVLYFVLDTGIQQISEQSCGHCVE